MLGQQQSSAKKSKTPAAAAKGQRTITSFFGGGASRGSPSTPSAAAPSASTMATTTAATPSASKLSISNADKDTSDTEDAVVATKGKRGKYVIDDDSDSEGGSGSSVKPAPKKRKTGSKKTADLDEFVVADEDHDMDEEQEDEEPQSSNKQRVDVLRTPSRKALDQFASPRFDFNKTPASQASVSTPFSASSNAKHTPFASDKKKDRADEFKKRNEDRYAWLLDEKDADKKRPGEEGYDPRSLYIPQSAWAKFSPFENQFWEIKSKHWDTVVFFKKGKFFELYEKDADLAHKEFDWKLTDRVNMKMCGVPEMSFDHWASQFVARGYKVAKVDQVENAIAKDMNKKKNGPSSSSKDIIRRELTMVLTAGTLVDTQLLTSDMSTYCMAIKEKSDNAEPEFGISFVDTSTAEFHISFFKDDAERTHLETLLLQLKPKELVLEKGGLSPKTLKMLKNCLNDPQCNYLMPDVEYWSADATVDELRRTQYFGVVSGDSAKIEVNFPDAVARIQNEPLAMASLGGLLSYLRSLKLDKDLVSARNFSIYDPLRQSGNLILDGQTLLNLEVFENTCDGSSDGTLFKLLNYCVTPSGKRLFKAWVCHPLQDSVAINSRLDAVDDIFGSTEFQDDVMTCFRKLPDLERIISRIHAGTSRVKDFMLVLKGFTDIFNFMVDVQDTIKSFKSKRLVQLLSNDGSETLRAALKFFEEAFDQTDGLNTTEIIANEGYDDVYDAAAAALEAIAEEFEAFRKEKERALGVKCGYKDLGKDLYQLEIPSSAASKKIPGSWIVQSKTQAVTRYYTPETKEMLERYLEAREERDQALKNVRSRMFAKFDELYKEWLNVVKKVAEIDCLLSLALCRAAMEGPLCRPEFVVVGPGESSVFEVVDLRHPCIHTENGKDFIPNDTFLGGGNGRANMILLTGPNMGGKSTLLRQTCIAVIMAQLGCYVPATSCRLSAFERIFTRIGAHDNILAGQSTFMVELSETSKILREATPKSLVILDELGRGTSTFDGFAIAFSVLYELVTRTKCLGLFSTHYGMLTKEFEGNGLVSLNHMSFVSDEEKHQVTFLYKLAEGACPKSFGMNVALMAGVPSSIVDTAEKVASEFESKLKMTRDHTSNGFEMKMSRQADFANLWNGRAERQVYRSLC
ncbi:putative DNA mismatch repair protein Msh6 [Obelidium mucronatum]|nr:putative DNA mismatch repair protein Msh6 [Obelidium mucronatum]